MRVTLEHSRSPKFSAIAPHDPGEMLRDDPLLPLVPHSLQASCRRRQVAKVLLPELPPDLRQSRQGMGATRSCGRDLDPSRPQEGLASNARVRYGGFHDQKARGVAWMACRSFSGNRWLEDVRDTLGEWNGTPVLGVCAWFKTDDGALQRPGTTVRNSGDAVEAA